MPYLFAHFKEKVTVDGEAVYFAISKDGLNWKEVNKGNPMLLSTLGECGTRDITVCRLKSGGFVIVTTDLCVARRMDENYNIDWRDINHNGSKCLCIWKTPDLINFSEQRLQHFHRDDFGCMWAPEVFYDELSDEYLVHWGSTVKESDYNHMSIYASTTKDFETFSVPKIFFDTNTEILDSHLVKFGDTYHLFYKNSNPGMNLHATSKNLWGPYENDQAFQDYMCSLAKPGSYEGPTSYVLPDGRWCLMLDYFGCKKSKMGYVPFISPKAGDASFKMAKEKFSFPYGFKHGGAIEITEEEYTRLENYRNAYNFPKSTGEKSKFRRWIEKNFKK